MPAVSSVFMGNESLLVQCAESWLSRGGTIARIVTRNSEIAKWAADKGFPTLDSDTDLVAGLGEAPYDWLFSVANLDLIPDPVLATANRGAINFHDGPLPRYAGLNAPVWALLAGETDFGITWHKITPGIDAGDIIAQETFAISDTETALTLNTKCYEAAIRGFGRVVDGIMADKLPLTTQDMGQRSYFARDKRPDAAARLNFTQSAQSLASMVRALDHGTYWNPLSLPKIEVAGTIYMVTDATVEPGHDPATPGTVLDIRADQILVATGDGALVLKAMRHSDGRPVEVVTFAQVGDVLPSPTAAQIQTLNDLSKTLAPSDTFWRAQLTAMQPARLALATDAGSGTIVSHPFTVPDGLTGDSLVAALAGFASRLAESDICALAYQSPHIANLTPAAYANNWVPVTWHAGTEDFDRTSVDFGRILATTRQKLTFACDLAARMPDINPLTIPDLGVSEGTGKMVDGTALTFAIEDGQVSLLADSGRVAPEYLDLIAARLPEFLTEIARDPARPLSDIPWLPAAERDLMVTTWNRTETPVSGPDMIHTAFEAQAAKTPDAVALVFEDQSLTFDALNRAANRVAHVLIAQGVKPGQPVALYMPRGTDMMVGALAILKAGGAYVPLDPVFPDARLRHYLKDSDAKIVVSLSALTGPLTDSADHSLLLDKDSRLKDAPDHNPDSGVNAGDLAYVIYTSGSTGTPKGVMVEHGNVANFFTGMDAKIDHENGGVWLAVTSLSFDISVLELFWTLSRGFKLVLFGEDRYHTTSTRNEPVHSDRHMDFSLFFWGNDDGPGPKKYQMLLDGARFADQHGFRAVWTPERHFHAFGGPYPNPAITGAAIAAVTSSIDVRSGSCVAPLHHPARIAEEWAVIDNLTNGRAGLGIAAGWQPYDFVLRPENAPPNNKAAMFDSIETLRKLWRGEEVTFPLADGSSHGVVTQPRPVSKELPIWVTTAGNPDTWREAGRIGANVLTHLLGQSIAEVGDKIEIYHDALRAAGHDPADFTVTLMLHTYLADSREQAREVARDPMKDYLRSAAGLIKQFAWVFPAFKRPEGVSNAFELDLGVLNDDELEEILDFAFLRYFEDSGLFGTVEDALARTEQLKQIGVDEVACLIDYGIDSAQVLAGLEPLAEVVSGANKAVDLADDDFSIAAQIRRHHVSHMQMTPSMAQMVLMDDAARGALAQIKHLFIGGEALPGPMVRDLNRATPARIENMYGPTETTIWSTTGPATPCAGTVNIGRPIANTQVYVLDPAQAPCAVGVAGELFIGGLGVTRGYHNRDALTADRFLPNPFTGQGRLYRTGDRVRQHADGRLEILGRTDNQVKLRGYRIELGEIEMRLAALTGAGTQVVVTAREDSPGDTRLVAYVTGGKVDEKALREALARDLPDYMIPTRIVALDSFPLTPNQKIDRNALPAPTNGASTDNVVGAFSHPKGQIERQIADIWSRILGVARIGSNDNFFDLGGHSLLAVQAHREIKAALNPDKLSITDIFRHPTLSGLAEMLAGESDTPNGDSSPDKAEARADAMSRRRAMRANRRR